MKNIKNDRLQQIMFLILLIVTYSSTPLWSQIPNQSPDRNQELMNEPFDISGDFRNFTNAYYMADSLASFDPATGKGEIMYSRYEYYTRMAFNNVLGVLRQTKPIDFPEGEYAVSPVLPFSVEFISPRTIRIRGHFTLSGQTGSGITYAGQRPCNTGQERLEIQQNR